MVVTRRGVAGVHVASHVMEELRLANVHAPTPHRQTEDMAAGDVEEQKNGKNVTYTSAQVIIFSFFLNIQRLVEDASCRRLIEPL